MISLSKENVKEVQTATLSTTCRMKVRAILVGDAALKMIMVTGWFFFFLQLIVRCLMMFCFGSSYLNHPLLKH